jgi:hypothetical protein
MSREDAPAALVLTWNASSVRVKCPYNCPQEIHRHGFTNVKPGRRNTRAPHCTPKIDDNGEVLFPQDYRLLFPFEEDPETEGLWWELDRQGERWRTVSWTIYDPEYYVQNEGTPSEGLKLEVPDDTESITRALTGLSIDRNSREMNHLKLELESFCVNNDLQEAREILHRVDGAAALINKKLFIEDKPLLLAVAEDGHGDMVELLLQYGANTEARDDEGNTALLRALYYGRGTLARKLMLAGADTEASNDAGDTVLHVARMALQAQKEHMRYNKLTIDREDDDIFEFGEELRARLKKTLQKIAEEVDVLQGIIESCNEAKALRQLATRLRKVGELFGEEQAAYVESHGALDHDALLARLLSRVADTPRKSEWKTVACMVRGEALPWVFAVSGYLSPALPGSDGTLHRPTWIHRVFEVAKTIGYDLKSDYRDESDRPGSYLACHSEKQLLAHFLWNHTTAFGRANLSASSNLLRNSETPTMTKLHAKLYVCQPGQGKADVCPDCMDFCRKVVQHYGFRLTLRGIQQGEIVDIEEFG